MSCERYGVTGFIAIILLGVILTGYSECAGTSRRPMTPAQADALVRRELPANASVSQVKEWLDAHQIEHSNYEPHHVGSVDGVIGGIIRDTARPSAFISADIQLDFTFNKQHRLIDHSVHELLTGP